MLRPSTILFQEFKEFTGSGGGAARERERPDPAGGRSSEHAMFESSRRRNLEAEQKGGLSGGIEESALGHTPEMNPAYPERHIAGIPGVGMAPAVPTTSEREPAGTAPSIAVRQYARKTAATAGRVVRKAREIRHMRASDVRDEAGRYIGSHPYSLIGAAVAGFLLGRLLRR